MPAAIHDESGLQAYTEETLQELEALLNGSLEKLERSDAFVDVTLVDEETIHNLNRDYRGVDAVTDVLSFAQEEASDEPGYTREADEPALLGDILICVKRALDQAEEYGHSTRRELGYLAIHGLLHLVGYDHDTAEKQQIMREQEEALLGPNWGK
ncbi:MAG TPA: rRNA maturation RNase YbeY [Bacillota bacterium]|nr:rRNA maturation RNase YbeY [Bacillota bacterium]